MSEKPLVSIVTVCYNARDYINTTIESVIEQTSRNYEYIIIDGMSKDGTTDIIESYMPVFPAKTHVKYISEPDSGIYDAMNKAIRVADGEWMIFMNAGDGFHHSQVLMKMAQYLESGDDDIIYGNQCWVEEGNTYIGEPRGADLLPQGTAIFHQSAFVRSRILKTNPFSLDYRIAGDYELFLRLYQKGYKYHYVPIIIANFAYGGISSKDAIGCLKENTEIRKKYGCVNTRTFKFKYWYVKEYCYQMIKSYIPRKLDLFIINSKKRLFRGEKR